MIRAANPHAREPRYDLVAHVLRDNIGSNALPPGLVLHEGPIADLMRTSRAPVQAALRLLLGEGLVRRFDGRGYLVAGGDGPPLRRDLRDLKLVIGPDIDEALRTRGTWRHVYDEVEAQVAACQVFGEFRVVEGELAKHLGVSRTVVRDVLSRLQERGLLRKNDSSHWVAGPLTARILREKYELRMIMEPAALRRAAPFIRHAEAEAVLARIDREPGLAWQRLEEAFMDVCIARAPNAALVRMIRDNRLVLHSLDQALTGLGLPPDGIAAEQYRTLFNLVARHTIDSAAEVLQDQLRIMAAKSLARMKIAALISESDGIAPYLIRL